MRLPSLGLNDHFFFAPFNHEGPEGHQLDTLVREVRDQAAARCLDVRVNTAFRAIAISNYPD
jgi:hypothetical protein